MRLKVFTFVLSPMLGLNIFRANADGIWNGDMTDPTEVAAHRYSIQWTGDITTDATALKKEFYNMIYGGAEMGIPYMSSDIGGHTGGDGSKDMYVRWMQYGALSTITQTRQLPSGMSQYTISFWSD